MEILNTTQCFLPDDKCLRFQYTTVLFRQNGKTFCAQSPHKKVTDLNALYNVHELKLEQYCPRIPPHATVFSPSDDVFIKKPNLLSDPDPGFVSSNTLHEIDACEVLRTNPHKNIAVYHGCNVGDQKVIGLCFKRYGMTLMEKMNPQGLNKSMFMGKAQRDGAQGYIEGIRRGIEHLHSLGFVHNDITPSNIMIDEEGNPVVMDFDSCRREGEDLQSVKRTYGWYDPKVKVSAKSNDLDALEEIRAWLTGTLADEFKFEKF